MAVVLSQNFTGTNGTNVNGFNSWTVKDSAGSTISTVQIQTNKAAMTVGGGVSFYAYASRTILWRGVRKGRLVFSRYTGSGARFINYLVCGSSDVSTYSNFINNGINMWYARSDSADSTTDIFVYDGTTLVTSAPCSFNADGTDLDIILTIQIDGSGTCDFVQSGTTSTLSWGARTWVKGGGNYFGAASEWNGNDGTSQLTQTQFDTVLIEGDNPYLAKIIQS